MAASGWTFLLARMIYVVDCRQGRSPRLGRDERRDATLLQEASLDRLKAGSFNDAAFERAAELYGLLYLKRYTPLNPAYTATFLKTMVGIGAIEMEGLRSTSGRLDGIIAFLVGGDVMTAPIVGYDTTQPVSSGLYRMLMAIAFARTRDRGMLFNASAGADGFKRNRGALPVVESSAVYAAHLSLRRRLALIALSFILKRIGVPIVKMFSA